jgi:hypothetical protein
VLKAERDSLARLVERKRFPKPEDLEQREEIMQKEETGKAGQPGEIAETGEEQLVSTQKTIEPIAVRNLPEDAVMPAPNVSEGASVPVERFFTTSAMDGLTPQGRQTQFKSGDVVYVYAGIHAPQAEQVRLEWIDPSGNVLTPAMFINVDVNTGSSGYRIYKNRKFQQAGKYEVKLYNSSGKMMGTTAFEVAE